MENLQKKKFDLYQIVLRFLIFKVTENLKRIYLDIDLSSGRMYLTAFYLKEPSELELELLDDIVTNTNAHIPDFFVESKTKLTKEFDRKKENHDFVVFAVYDDL